MGRVTSRPAHDVQGPAEDPIMRCKGPIMRCNYEHDDATTRVCHASMLLRCHIHQAEACVQPFRHTTVVLLTPTSACTHACCVPPADTHRA